MASFARLLSTQQCLFNPKKTVFKPPSFQITTGIKKEDLVKGLEDRILVWPLYFLKYLLDLFWQNEIREAYPSYVKFHIERIRNISKQ